ncbi:MAG: DUF3857 domain-containing protein [Acidobacteriota bacterium]
MRLGPIVRLGILVCGAAIPLTSLAQFQAPTKEELSMTSDPQAPGAAAVYLYREVISQDPLHHTTVYARIKILKPEGLKAATVHIRYHRNFAFYASGDNSSHMGSGSATHWSTPSANRQGEDAPWNAESYNVRTEIAAIQGRTIHPDGTIVPLTGKDSTILQVKKDPHHPEEMYFTLPDVTVGSIIEYRYQIRYDRFVLAPDWQVQEQYPIMKEHFSFTPADPFMPDRNQNNGSASLGDAAVLDIHSQSLTDVRYSQTLPVGKVVRAEASGMYTLDMTDVPPFPAEAYGPPADGLSYGVRFFYTPGPDPNDFWKKEMGFWMRSLDKYAEPSQALRSAAAEAYLPTDSALVKAKKLYDLVQKLDNTDFLPNGSCPNGSISFPFTKADKVLLDKKGTSNQIAYLYYALARIAGLNPTAERVASRSVHLFDYNTMAADQLDSVLISMNIGDKEIIVDPGTKFAPFGTLHWAHTGTNGLAMVDNKVVKVSTPLQKVTDNTTLHVGTVTVAANGDISGLLKVAFLGQKAIELRQLSVTSGPEAVKDAIDKLVASEVPAGVQAKVDHVAYLDDTSKQLLAVIPVSGTLAGQTKGKIALPRFFFESREANPFPAEGDRTLPIDMRYPAQDQEQITYQTPAGFTLESKPQDAVLRFSQDAGYEARTRVASNAVTNARVLARAFTFLSPKDYAQLHDFYQKVVATDQQQLVLGSSQANSAQ